MVLGWAAFWLPEVVIYAEPRTGDVRHSMAGIEKASNVLGYFPKTGFEEGLRLTVEWFALKNGR